MNQKTINVPTVVAFDFDGTLTRRDTLFPFLWYLKGWTGFARSLAPVLPSLAAYAAGAIKNGEAKERVLASFLGGRPHEMLKEWGRRFAAERIPELLRGEAMHEFREHRRRGHRCVVVSASMDIYVEPWALASGFDEVICSRLECAPNGEVTGRIEGGNCYGIEKLTRLRQRFGPRDRYRLIAYGDSRGDLEMLADADEAYYRFQKWQISR